MKGVIQLNRSLFPSGPGPGRMSRLSPVFKSLRAIEPNIPSRYIVSRLFVGTKGEGRCWYGFSNGLVWPDEPPYPPVPEYPHDQRGWWSERFVGRGQQEAARAAALRHDEHRRVSVQRQVRPAGTPRRSRLVRPRRRYLYVFEFRADGDKSLVHVWQVKP